LAEERFLTRGRLNTYMRGFRPKLPYYSFGGSVAGYAFYEDVAAGPEVDRLPPRRGPEPVGTDSATAGGSRPEAGAGPLPEILRWRSG
jgi:hypothetical protein